MVDPFFATIFLLAVLASIRNELVGRAYKRFLDELEIGDPDFYAKLALCDTRKYRAYVFDLTKWRYRQFFPPWVPPAGP